MFNRKDASSSGVVDTLIGTNSIFEGNINCEGTIRIEGKVKGDLTVDGTVFVGTKAVIEGNVYAGDVHLSGSIEGNIRSKGVLRLLSTAKLCGDIEVYSFVADEGAVFMGKCSMLDHSAVTVEGSGEKSSSKKRSSARDYKKSSVLDQVYEEKENTGEVAVK